MPEQPFTENPQLDRFLTKMNYSMENITQKLDDHSEVHTKILTQTTITNGRVANIQTWRERVNGAVLASAVIIPFVVGGIGWVAMIIINDQITKSVAEALSVYEVPESIDGK